MNCIRWLARLIRFPDSRWHVHRSQHWPRTAPTRYAKRQPNYGREARSQTSHRRKPRSSSSGPINSIDGRLRARNSRHYFEHRKEIFDDLMMTFELLHIVATMSQLHSVLPHSTTSATAQARLIQADGVLLRSALALGGGWYIWTTHLAALEGVSRY